MPSVSHTRSPVLPAKRLSRVPPLAWSTVLLPVWTPFRSREEVATTVEPAVAHNSYFLADFFKIEDKKVVEFCEDVGSEE